MNKIKNIISSFDLKNDLNSQIWKKSENGEYGMKSEVREKLLNIANDFIDFIGFDIIIEDIELTGSLANYNWSEYSDVDIHIIIDFDQFSEKLKPLYKELFTLKKTIYNEKHNIKIYGFDVELYAQESTEVHFSSGVYSILFDKWINTPKKEKIKIDTSVIKSKSSEWMKIIDSIYDNVKDEEVDEVKNTIKKYKEKLKKYRKSGLEKNGEFSNENLVFKVLRRNGYIKKLFDLENKILDNKLTLKEYQKILNIN